MATPVSTPIDIPLMLFRLCPTAEYHWKGNGWGLYSDVGEWRSPDIPQPTEAEVYAEWDQYLVEREGQPDPRIAAAERFDAIAAFRAAIPQYRADLQAIIEGKKADPVLFAKVLRGLLDHLE